MSTATQWFGFGRCEHFDQAMRFWRAGQHDDAIDSLRASLKHHVHPSVVRLAKSQLIKALKFRAIHRLGSDQPDLALKDADEALSLAPYADIYLLQAQILVATGDLDRAESSAQLAIKANPNYRAAFELLRDLQLRSNPGEAAETQRRLESIEKEPVHLGSSSVAERLQNADSQLLNGQVLEASKILAELVSERPTFADVRCRYGETLLELEEVDAALAEFEAALAVNPKYADAWAEKGIALKRLRKTQEAREAFKECARWQPDHPVVALELG